MRRSSTTPALGSFHAVVCKELQEVAVDHFAERYGTFIIICLGESIVAIGLTATVETLDAAVVAVVTLGLTLTIALWWTYFGGFGATASEHLRNSEEPVLAASDAYSYIHIVLVAGIIVFAVGMRHAVRDVDATLAEGARLALCGGLAAYLLGYVGFQARLARSVSYEKLGAATLLALIFALGSGLRAWEAVAACVGALALLCSAEALSAMRGVRA